MNLSEISWFVSGEQINYLPKSKAEANDWSVLSLIRSPKLFFNEYLRETKRSAIFTQERSQEGEKRGFIYAWTEYQLQPNLPKHLSQTTKETFVCACSNFSRVFVLFTKQANLSGRNWSPQLRRSRLSFNRSSVSQVKDINIKKTQREDRKACFKFFTVCFRSIKLCL